MQQILTEKDSTVRLVLTPEAVVVAEARRSLTTLSLYGYRVDGVIANRVFPEGEGDAWREPAGWRPSRRCSPRSGSPSPTCRSGSRSTAPGEPVGADALASLAEAAYDGTDPLAVPTGEGPMTITRTSTGAVLRIALPVRPEAGRRPGPAR